MTLKTSASVFNHQGSTALKLAPEDRQVYDKILGKALEKGERIRLTIQTESKSKSQKQQGLYFALLGLLWKVVNGTAPTQEEKLEFHEEIKALHAHRKPSRLHPGVLVPIGVSESDTDDMSVLIDGVYEELWSLDLTKVAQGEARELWFKYWELGGPRWTNEEDFRARANLCAATGLGEDIELCHIRSRGASATQKDDPNNWLPMSHKAHMEQHQIGWPAFLRKYPHLRKRVEEILGEQK